MIQSVFGLGGSGYVLEPTGSIEDGVMDILVTARVPADAMGLTVLTAYEYRLGSPPLVPGSYRVRLRQGMDDEGATETVLDTTVVVGPAAR